MVVTGHLQPLRLRGRLDASTVTDVRAAVYERIESTTTSDVVLDLTDVTLVDQTGLGMLVAAHLRLQREGRMLVLRGCTPAMHRILAVTRLLRVLNVEVGSRQA
jgi:anti-sigma B factor antagonist